ncbi:MAG: thiamine-phosphate kinase [Candidatus Hodarchaeales archaeon]
MPSLKEMGERKIIQKLQKYITSHADIQRNEDAYYHEFQNKAIVVNIDSMSRKTDFLPGQTWKQTGHKLVTITVSDLAAKGAVPEIFLSSLVMEPDMAESDLIAVVEGIRSGCRDYNCLYMGGDLGSSSETTIVGCSIGYAIEGRMIKRHTAEKGDIVCVTGPFGLTGYGLSCLLGKKKPEIEVESEKIRDKAINSLYSPVARLREGILLNEYNLASASIDSSDGLALSLYWLAKQSNLRITIERLPLDSLLKDPCFAGMRENWALYGGEEYEIVFTVNPADLGRLETIFAENNCSFIAIGRCDKGSGVVLADKKAQTEVNPSGWDPFK